jgi:hypothetical protein
MHDNGLLCFLKPPRGISAARWTRHGCPGQLSDTPNIFSPHSERSHLMNFGPCPPTGCLDRNHGQVHASVRVGMDGKLSLWWNPVGNRPCRGHWPTQGSLSPPFPVAVDFSLCTCHEHLSRVACLQKSASHPCNLESQTLKPENPNTSPKNHNLFAGAWRAS